MTPQQAGVSAEAAAKLVEKWRSGNCGASENELVKVSHKTFLKCADELEQALATAPPEQACVWSDWPGIFAETIRNIIETRCHPQSLKDARFNLESYSKQIGDTRPIKPDQPQAVSAGALELAENIFNDFVSTAAAAAFARAHSSKWNDFDRPCYISGIAALLAAHDQTSSKTLPDGFAEIVKDLREIKVHNGGSHEKPIKEAFNWIADRIEHLLNATPIIHGQAELAAHDQKVRAEVLAGISERLLAKAFPMTPHGEAEGCVTLTDINAEFRAASGAERKS